MTDLLSYSLVLEQPWLLVPAAVVRHHGISSYPPHQSELSMLKRNRIFITLLFLAVLRLDAQWGGQLRLALRSDPKTFDPLLVDDGPGETIRYLTGGVLVRLNRTTQKLQPELAKSWKISEDGRTLSVKLQENISFSDGTPFTAEDVVYTLKRMMEPHLSPQRVTPSVPARVK